MVTRCPNKCFYRSDEDLLWELGLQRLERQKMKGHIDLYNYLTAGCRQVGVGVFYVTNDKMRGNSFKLCQGSLRLGTGKKFFSERIIKN